MKLLTNSSNSFSYSLLSNIAHGTHIKKPHWTLKHTHKAPVTGAHFGRFFKREVSTKGKSTNCRRENYEVCSSEDF
jgi:hypothetical protein